MVQEISQVSERKTFSLKAGEIQKKWYVIDATDLIVGRLAAFLADRLRGKHKPSFTPHMDGGDCMIVVNADKVHLTGQKWDQRIWYHYSGYVGGLKERTSRQLLQGARPERVLRLAVQRMIEQGPLRRSQMRHLFVYAGAEHPHAAQQPEVLDFGALSVKNRRRA